MRSPGEPRAAAAQLRLAEVKLKKAQTLRTHVSQLDSPGMREYLTFASPAEFRSRNIFTEERPLRRARIKVA